MYSRHAASVWVGGWGDVSSVSAWARARTQGFRHELARKACGPRGLARASCDESACKAWGTSARVRPATRVGSQAPSVARVRAHWLGSGQCHCRCRLGATPPVVRMACVRAPRDRCSSAAVRSACARCAAQAHARSTVGTSSPARTSRRDDACAAVLPAAVRLRPIGAPWSRVTLTSHRSSSRKSAADRRSSDEGHPNSVGAGDLLRRHLRGPLVVASARALRPGRDGATRRGSVEHVRTHQQNPMGSEIMMQTINSCGRPR